MNLDEALAVYLYLNQYPIKADWNREIMDKAWRVISREAEFVMRREAVIKKLDLPDPQSVADAVVKGAAAVNDDPKRTR